jgi:hypothetical protein
VRLLPVVTLAAVALVAAAPAPAARSAYFESPSRNIVCGYFSGAGVPALLECGVASGLVPPAPRPAGRCVVVDPATNRVQLGPSGRTYGFCSGDAGVLAEQGRAPVLAYGTTWRGGPYRCTSAVTGLTCRNAAAHGFFLSRQRWHPF